ncbi:hypothetical protein Cenrod_2517 [Candidatus Symbiobacter mobilis CR]|uniref:Uncharacterized protein n=1 Tax=Candidatus Symbiobacter mobilis CR TaxID=946483 RepID=U5NAI7_9BURK|nr:hypothetical protein Cenrod_2517 [Candidatus Symbiobacter mobilis CR]
MWELPGVRVDPFPPKHLIFLVEQDDADIGPESVPVEHNQSPIVSNCSDYAQPGPLVGIAGAGAALPPLIDLG